MGNLVRRIDANPPQQPQPAVQRRRRQPAAVQGSPRRRQVDGHRDPRALLTPNPRTLHVLWDEYIRGIGGNKPAREFTRAERGPVKHKYSRRKVFWDLVEELCRAGHSSNDVIDRIYSHYGQNKAPTTIINGIRKDRKDDRLPLGLRV